MFELTESKDVRLFIIKKTHICINSLSMFFLILASHWVFMTEYEMNLTEYQITLKIITVIFLTLLVLPHLSGPNIIVYGVFS